MGVFCLIFGDFFFLVERHWDFLLFHHFKDKAKYTYATYLLWRMT